MQYARWRLNPAHAVILSPSGIPLRVNFAKDLALPRLCALGFAFSYRSPLSLP